MATISNPNVMLGRMFMQTRGALPPAPTLPPQAAVDTPPRPLVAGGPQPPQRVTPPHPMRTGGPQPPATRPLSQLYTGGPLPPGQVITRAGGMLPERNSGVVPPHMRPGGDSMPRMPRSASLPATQMARLPQTNSQGMRMPTANPVGRPAGGMFKGV